MIRERHLVRGALSGLLLGIGLALLLFSYAKIAIGTLAFPGVIAAGLVLGLAVGFIGRRAPSAPAPTGPPPA